MFIQPFAQINPAVLRTTNCTYGSGSSLAFFPNNVVNDTVCVWGIGGGGGGGGGGKGGNGQQGCRGGFGGGRATGSQGGCSWQWSSGSWAKIAMSGGGGGANKKGTAGLGGCGGQGGGTGGLGSVGSITCNQTATPVPVVRYDNCCVHTVGCGPHGIADFQKICFCSTGALPNPLLPNTVYYAWWPSTCWLKFYCTNNTTQPVTLTNAGGGQLCVVPLPLCTPILNNIIRESSLGVTVGAGGCLGNGATTGSATTGGGGGNSCINSFITWCGGSGGGQGGNAGDWSASAQCSSSGTLGAAGSGGQTGAYNNGAYNINGGASGTGDCLDAPGAGGGGAVSQFFMGNCSTINLAGNGGDGYAGGGGGSAIISSATFGAQACGGVGGTGSANAVLACYVAGVCTVRARWAGQPLGNRYTNEGCGGQRCQDTSTSSFSTIGGGGGCAVFNGVYVKIGGLGGAAVACCVVGQSRSSVCVNGGEGGCWSGAVQGRTAGCPGYSGAAGAEGPCAGLCNRCGGSGCGGCGGEGGSGGSGGDSGAGVAGTNGGYAPTTDLTGSTGGVWLSIGSAAGAACAAPDPSCAGCPPGSGTIGGVGNSGSAGQVRIQFDHWVNNKRN